MITKNISSITQYIDEVKSINFNENFYGHNLWFRAENSKFDNTYLIPNLYREYIIGPAATVEFYIKEWNLRAVFRNEAYPFLRKFDLINDDLGTAFVMQHYSSHTRLLDWTENSLIALFFAVENVQSNNDAFIWVLDPFKLNSSTNKFVSDVDIEELRLYPSINPEKEVLSYFDIDLLKAKSKEVKYPIALKPFYIDDRMKSQNSCFTLFGHELDGLKQHPFVSDFLKQIVIPFEHFRQIKRDLYQLGISYDSIYPGLEGISKKNVYAFDEYFI